MIGRTDLSKHVPSLHANIEDEQGNGHSWIECSCTYQTRPAPSLRQAWDRYYEHIGATREKTPRRVLVPQVERLFEDA